MMTPTDISKYNININNLKNAKSKLLKSDINDDVLKEIDFLNSFIDDEHLVKKIFLSNNKKFQINYKNDFNMLMDEYYDYLSYIFDFYDLVCDEYKMSTYEKIVTSYDEVLSSVHDFFKNLDDEWFKLFMNIYKERFNTIKFSNDRSYSILFPKSNIWIANLQTNLTIEDYVYATHEFAHGIAEQFNPSVKSYSAKNILLEMFPILCQMLFLDNSSLPNQIEVNKAIENYRKIMIDFAEETKFKFNIASKLGSYMNSPKCASRIIKKVFGQVLSKNELSYIYSNSVEENIVYVFPFLVAVELVDLYHKDKDLFKYKVNKILTSDSNPLILLDDLDIEVNKILKK